jgi:hypothetical protein
MPEESARIDVQKAVKSKNRIKDLLVHMGATVVPLTVVFEALGYTGLTGLGWGILSATIASVADELGYEVRVIGARYFLMKNEKQQSIPNLSTIQEEESSGEVVV